MTTIKVKVVQGFTEHQNNSDRTLLCEVKEGEILEAKLHRETDEYFAKDSQGREVYVGCIGLDGKLKLDEDLFVLI